MMNYASSLKITCFLLHSAPFSKLAFEERGSLALLYGFRGDFSLNHGEKLLLISDFRAVISLVSVLQAKS